MEPIAQSAAPLLLPPPPPLNLKAPQLKADPTIQKYLKAKNAGQFKSQQDEMKAKHKPIEQQKPEVAMEGESVGECPRINITDYAPCQRCFNWVIRKEMQFHKACHASVIIQDFLYLGGMNTASNPKELSQLMKVKYILNCAAECSNVYADEGFIYKRLDLQDNLSENIMEHFDSCFQFIESARNSLNRVYVHCAVGKSRSATVVIAYIMWKQKKTLRQAYEYVKKCRSVISPNPNYIHWLLTYEKQLYNVDTNSIEGGEILPVYKFLYKNNQQ